MVCYFPCCIHTVVTGYTGRLQRMVYLPRFQCCVIKARSKAAASLVAILARICGRRVSAAFADGFNRIACDMTTDAGLGFNGRLLVVDWIGFQEITGRGVTGIAFPAIRINGAMH